ncbi:MAG: hypothetical protein IPM36_07605 [Lewinellaceae bacterium]|jgi:hypothetical protein|nr:hypothetical protein [Lewinellaceae bacterium]
MVREIGVDYQAFMLKTAFGQSLMLFCSGNTNPTRDFLLPPAQVIALDG